MKKLTLLALLLTSSLKIKAENFMIYSIAQDFPMGIPGEVLRKNYYINIGLEQGVTSGTELSVYRLISITNPFAKNKQEIVNHKVKIGEIKVIHSETNHAIATSSEFNLKESELFFEVDSVMIGDHIAVKTN
jgi:hypothetical protein